MTGLGISLVRLVTRALVALAVALGVGLVIALLGGGDDWRRDFGVACLVVGCLFLLIAPAGQSPAMRSGTIDVWTASFFPKLVPGMADYGGRTLSESVVLGLVGIALLALGALLVG